MSESVNFNSFVSSSSIVDYKKFIEGKDTGEAKVYKTSEVYVGEDEEGILVLGDENSNEDVLSARVEKMIESFSEEINYSVAYQIMQFDNVDWDEDDGIAGLKSAANFDLALYKGIIKNAMNDFLAKYTGDGSEIESEFESYIKDVMKNDAILQSIVAKYNNDGIADRMKQASEKASATLSELEASDKNDPYTQSRKNWLTLWIANSRNFIDNAPKTAGGLAVENGSEAS